MRQIVVWWCWLVFTVLAWPALAANNPGRTHQCHEQGAIAVLDAAASMAGDAEACQWGPAEVDKCLGDLSRWGGGSGNWPVQLRTGLLVCGAVEPTEPPVDQLLGWLRGENGWGLNQPEAGSCIYEAWNVFSVYQIYHAAHLRGWLETEVAARRWLRAWAGKAHLTRSPRAKQVVVIGQKGRQARAAIRPDYRAGPMVYMAGERSQMRPAHGNLGALPERCLLSPAYAWLTDAPGRRWRGGGPMDTDPLRWRWPLTALSRQVQGRFEQPLPVPVFSAEELQALRGPHWLASGRPSPGLLLAAKVLGEFDPQGRSHEWLYGSGWRAECRDASVNGNKPGWPAVLAEDESGRVTVFSPLPYSGVKAGRSFCARQGQELKIWGSRGGEPVSYPLPGSVLGRVTWTSTDGVQIFGKDGKQVLD